uniref:GNAT family N-acetyltransferase n=1 Tax=Frankia sp. Cr1 TaxID=3073931 RepID=UPI002AD5486A
IGNMLQKGELALKYVSASETEIIEHLIEFGDTARRTLGLLPRGAYFEAASRDCLLAALWEGRPVGYTLFRLPRNLITLTHVCVHPDFQRRGIAARLVEDVSARHRERLGVRAKCRDDYPNIKRVWHGLGFTAASATRGRGRDQAPMTIWWRDHGHPHLFTSLDEPPALRVAIDINILMDLRAGSGQPRAERSHVLLSPELSGRIELVVSHGLERDLARQSADRRERLQAVASDFPRPQGPEGLADDLFIRLLGAMKKEIPNFPVTEQDIGDLWQVVEAAAAGVSVLLTWDDKLLQAIAPVVLRMDETPELARMRIINPDYLVIHLDELTHAAAYEPKALEGGRFSVELARSDSEAILMSFLDRAKGEPRRELRDRLRGLARRGYKHSVVRAPDGTPVACYARVVDDEVLRVSLFRVAAHPVAETVARYLLWFLRRTAREAHAKVVEISDPYLSDIAARAASYESYCHVGDRWYAWVIDHVGPGMTVSAAVNSACQLVGLGPAPLIAPRMPAQMTAQYERTWWPVKITDSSLPHFAIAIQPRWSADLLGAPPTLLPRPDELALGREFVYYRNGRKSVLVAPARIVWYLSGHQGSGPASFIGTSLLDAIDTDTPDSLYPMLSHYGVFRLSDVHDVADKNGFVQALRLSDMELFSTPVSRSSYLRLLEKMPGPKAIQAPVNMPTATFRAIYTLGMSNSVM